MLTNTFVRKKRTWFCWYSPIIYVSGIIMIHYSEKCIPMHSFFAWDAFLFFMDILKLDLVDLGCIRNQKVQFWQRSREKTAWCQFWKYYCTVILAWSEKITVYCCYGKQIFCSPFHWVPHKKLCVYK